MNDCGKIWDIFFNKINRNLREQSKNLVTGLRLSYLLIDGEMYIYAIVNEIIIHNFSTI